jgi:A/G-specific adenine glycosylase
MELGSTVCLPRQPRCDECPVQRLCPTRERGWQDRIPAPSRKTRYEDVLEAAVVVFPPGGRQRVLLRRCSPDERWAGLWDYPRFALASPEKDAVHQQLISATRAMTGVDIQPQNLLARWKHGVTRFRITLVCYAAEAMQENLKADENQLRWVPRDQLELYPLNSTGRRISRLLERRI